MEGGYTYERVKGNLIWSGRMSCDDCTYPTAKAVKSNAGSTQRSPVSNSVWLSDSAFLYSFFFSNYASRKPKDLP